MTAVSADGISDTVRRLVAYHEAGHAVTARVEGARPLGIYASRTGDRLVSRAPYAGALTPEGHARIALAGGIAEVMAGGDDVPLGHDGTLAEQARRNAGGSSAWIDARASEAERMLRENRWAVEAVASLVVAQGVVTADEIERVIVR